MHSDTVPFCKGPPVRLLQRTASRLVQRTTSQTFAAREGGGKKDCAGRRTWLNTYNSTWGSSNNAYAHMRPHSPRHSMTCKVRDKVMKLESFSWCCEHCAHGQAPLVSMPDKALPRNFMHNRVGWFHII
eukprot:1140620-Pelagomonas_calceolata.AAC.9